MAWHKPYDDKELAFIRENYPKLTCNTIAAKLGRSGRGVRNAVQRMGLAPCAPARTMENARAKEPPAPPPAADGPQDELSELRDIKRVLKRTLRDDIDPRDMPKISAELREVIKRISEIEEGGADGLGTMAGGSGNIVVSVPLRPA